jgi:hypothetical protein
MVEERGHEMAAPSESETVGGLVTKKDETME